MLPPWWRALLLLTSAWLHSVTCTELQLQPVTRLAGWHANGSWVLNGPRTVAAGIPINSSNLHVLQHSMGAWLLADVIAPPEADETEFLPESVVLSTDGRLMAVAAATHRLPQGTAGSQQQITAGYVYRVVAQPHSQQAFRYQLAGRLSLPIGSNSSRSRSSSSRAIGHVDMSADGRVMLACWAYTAEQASPPVKTPYTTKEGRSVGRSGGAAVFTWRGFGQSLMAVQLPPPQGSQSFGQACKLSGDGHTALVLDGSTGAMVYSREVHTARGATAGYRATGWLAGAPAQQQYQVLAAGLSPEGSQAALLVQGVRPGGSKAGAAGSSTALKVFAADGLRRWTGVCSITLGTGTATTGAVKLAPFSGGGVNVWAALDSIQLMYAVGMEAPNATHCPSQPVLQTVPSPTPSDSSTGRVAGAVRRAAAAGAGLLPQQTNRAGKLRVDGLEAVFVAME